MIKNLNVGNILTVAILALLVYDAGLKVVTQQYLEATFTLCVLVFYVGREVLQAKRGY